MDAMDAMRNARTIKESYYGFYISRGTQCLYMNRDGTWHWFMGEYGGTYFETYDEAARVCYGSGDDSFDPIYLGC